MIACSYPECPVPAQSSCDICDAKFCSDHGTANGYSLVAQCDTSACWKCGGFNADE